MLIKWSEKKTAMCLNIKIISQRFKHALLETGSLLVRWKQRTAVISEVNEVTIYDAR